MTHAPVPAGASIAIVGAGIVGLSCAFVLAERGYAVTLIERDEPGRSGPSFGNAGQIAAQGIHPLASPGIGLRGLRMLANRDAPLKIPVSYMPEIAPWLWRFWRTSHGEAQARAISALSPLAQGGLDETEALWRRAGFAELLTRQPCIYLYDSEASFNISRAHWNEKIRRGFKSTPLDASAIRELEPSLAPIFPRAWLSHDYGHVTDPYEIVNRMTAAALERGVTLERAEVRSLQAAEGGATVATEAGERRFDAVMVSAGVWSKPLAASLGENLPVEAERGYNLSFAGLKGRLSHPLLFADRGIAATPLATGLRFGGWTELAGTSAPPNPAHWQKLREIGEAVLPGLGTAEAREWMGHRPSMPDSVPVLSRSGKAERVFYAVGHGHYGLSYSARTAKLMGELIGAAADETLAAYSIARFN